MNIEQMNIGNRICFCILRRKIVRYIWLLLLIFTIMNYCWFFLIHLLWNKYCFLNDQSVHMFGRLWLIIEVCNWRCSRREKKNVSFSPTEDCVYLITWNCCIITNCWLMKKINMMHVVRDDNEYILFWSVFAFIGAAVLFQ